MVEQALEVFLPLLEALVEEQDLDVITDRFAPSAQSFESDAKHLVFLPRLHFLEIGCYCMLFQ